MSDAELTEMDLLGKLLLPSWEELNRLSALQKLRIAELEDRCIGLEETLSGRIADDDTENPF